MALTSKIPFVSVPVLSKTTYFVLAKVSIKLEPLIKIPLRLAPPNPAKKLKGTLTTKAHGQLIIKNINDLYIQLLQLGSILANIQNKGGIIAKARAL